MSVVYSLYDALVSIKVPDEKAKAVIDAMEREMMDKLATKADLEHVREILSKDIKGISLDLAHSRELFSRDIQGLADKTEASIQALANRTEASITGLATNTDTKIQGLAKKAELAELGSKLTTRLYMAVAGAVALNCSILGTLIVFSR
jgi:hypothetical protein